MTRPELFKLTHHRTPWVLAGALTLFTLAAPAWYAFRGPTDPSLYLETMTGVFGLAAALLAAVFGAWIVGHEYRQGTLRRVVASDARRGRLLAVKAMVGAGAFAVVTAVVAGLGVGAKVRKQTLFDTD